MKIVSFMLLFMCAFSMAQETDWHCSFGNYTEASLKTMIDDKNQFADAGKQVEVLSAAFLGTDYQGKTLCGGPEQSEKLIFNIAGVDCFTMLDYIEAVRGSDNYKDIKPTLMKVRYQESKVSYKNRNHFFSDWAEYNSDTVRDVTFEIAGDDAKEESKCLNLSKQNSVYLKGIPVKDRNIVYIPTEKLSKAVLGKLKSGDYVGIYSHLHGLDVTHVGVLIKKQGKVFMRHASSLKKYRKVVDEELLPYLKSKKRLGIIVYRPL